MQGRNFDNPQQESRVNGQMLAKHDVDIKRLMRALERLGSIDGLPPGSDDGLSFSLGGTSSVLLGKTDSAISADSTGTVSLWSGTLGSETDTTNNVTGYSRGVNIDSGKWVNVMRRGGGWEIYPLECND